MSFLRRAVAGVWNFIKPADATSNPVIAATETTEKDIDLVIEKSEGLLSYNAAASNPEEETLVRNAATELLVTAANTERYNTHELTGINEKVKEAWEANNTAAVANNNNAEKSNKLSNDLDTARGLVLHDLPIPISPEQAGQAVLAQAAQEAFNQALHQTRRRDIAQSAAQAAAASPETQAAAQAAQRAAQEARPEAEAAATAASGRIATLVPQVGITSLEAIRADERQSEANNKLNEQKYKCLPDVVFEYNVADKEKLTALRAQLLESGISTLQFRDSCVAESAEQLAGILKQYNGWSIADAVTTSVSQLMMSRFTESWTPYLNCPSSVDDESVDTQNRIFYNRVTSCLEALGTYSVFLSSPWAEYRRSENQRYLGNNTLPGVIQPVGAYARPPLLPPFGAPPPPPPPPPPAPAESYYDTVTIGPYHYVIGPILDFQNIEGRIFIYIKCYDNREYTAGTYFWVYRSQSEGLYRVFFKLIAKLSIEKGYDYTQATLVHFKLQLALNKYYDRHAQRGVKNPIILNTLSRLNYFVGNMSYLQQPTFLDLFPNRANIIPSFYSIPGEANTVWGAGWSAYHGQKPGYCNRARQPPAGQAATECCYVCLIPPPPPPPPPLPPPLPPPGVMLSYNSLFVF